MSDFAKDKTRLPKTPLEIRLEEAREKVADILADRWQLDEEDGWEEFGKATLDDIERVYVSQLAQQLLLVSCEISTYTNRT